MPTGFFGKLPAAGDFVSRGLPAGLRAPLDHWVTTHIAPLARDAQGWPVGGVRLTLHLAGEDWLLVTEPSADAAGRSYPLVACVPLAGAGREAADHWADAVWPILLTGIEGMAGPDTLATTIAQTELLPAEAPPLSSPQIWWRGQAPGNPDQQLLLLERISSG